MILFKTEITNKQNLIKNFKYELLAHVEDLDIHVNFDNEDDIKYILNELYNGNDAAWFTAEIRVSYKSLTHSEYLGCCSYASFEEFIDDEYCNDMIHEASNNMLNMIRDIADEYNKAV